MSRKLIISAWMLTLILLAGCEDQTVKSDQRYMITDPAQAAVITSKGLLVPGAREVDLVEQVMAARQQYRQTVEDLLKFYRSEGNAANRQWATNELTAIDQVPQYFYIMPAAILPPDLMAREDIIEANILYEDAMQLYKEAGGLLIITDEGKLRGALNRFNQLMMQYQTSNKIDDAAYRAGRIYEHFGDYQIAAIYYQRCFQWNDVTRYPARFRAGFLLDQRLHMRKEALTLYQLAVQREKQYTANTEFAQKRIFELTKSIPAPASANRTTVAPLGATGTSVDSFSDKLDAMP